MSLAEFGLKVGAWSVTAGLIAASNDGAASIVTGDGKDAACIRVPRAGLVTTVPAGGAVDVPAGPLFSLRYYEDGAVLIDPFAELRAFCDRIRAALAAKQRADEQKRRRRKRVLTAAVACCAVLAVVWGIAVMRRPAPFKVGKINVSHFSGLKPGDTEARVASLYGPAVAEFGAVKFYANKNLTVFYKDGIVKGVLLSIDGRDSARSRAGDDGLLDFLGRSQDEAVASLGPPKSRDPKDSDLLFWSFPMDGRPAGQSLDETTDQTLTLGFQGARCSFIQLKW